MIKTLTIKQSRIKRLPRIRSVIKGDAKRPRLSVYRSNKTLSAQCINDVTHTVLLTERISGKNMGKAIELGKIVAAAIMKKGITTVVFDRSGYQYHGVIKAFADAVREGGVKI